MKGPQGGRDEGTVSAAAKRGLPSTLLSGRLKFSVMIGNDSTVQALRADLLVSIRSSGREPLSLARLFALPWTLKQ